MRLSEAVATRVKEILRERNMTQAQLERLSTIHHGTMNDLLSSVYKTVNLKTVYLIIRAFEMKVSDFFDHSIFERNDIEVD